MPPVARTRKDSSGSPPSDGEPKEHTKRKRQSQSCDACRARKVRCARENPENQREPCKHCVALGIPCTYDYQPKKRGPPNLYLRRLQEAAAAAAAAKQQESGAGAKADPDFPGTTGAPSSSSVPTAPPVATVTTSPPQSALSPPLTASTSTPSYFSDSPTLTTPGPSTVNVMSLPPSRYPIAADTFPTLPPSLPLSDHSPGVDSPFGASSSTYPLYNWSYRQTNQRTTPPPPPPHPSSHVHAASHALHTPTPPAPLSFLTPLSYYYRPHRLEDIAPRDTISLIVALFFDFVYPLTPCLHKPSFMADLHARREERDPLFFALVMSTVASTLVQVPRSYLPMERHVVRKLAQTCYEASRHISVTSYDPPTSMHVIVRYFDCVYHFCEGHDATQHAAYGEAAHLAVTLRMHEEASYEGLDPIECEVRRRTFWLLFGADKSMSILLGRPICLRDEDCTVHFPKELDDEYITSSAYLPQPHGKTAIVSGLNYTSRIFALLGEILVRIRVDKRSPPQGQFATARLEEVQSLHARILNALSHAPEPLRLKLSQLAMGAGGGGGAGSGGAGAGAGLPNEYGGAGFRQATFAEVKDFFDNPHASRANALNPFLVMQANLYVTQQVVRFVIEQYRDELLSSLQGPLDEFKVAQDRETIASDLLNILHSIPIQSIATNGPSLVHKVRFVASTLLDAVRRAETAPQSAARAHAFLWDFLSILSEIERNYLLDDERDGDSTVDSLGMVTN